MPKELSELGRNVKELHRRQRAESQRELDELAANENSIALATAGELWRGALDRRWGGARRGGPDLWLATTLVIPAGLAVGRIWASISARAQRRGRPRPLNDT